MSEKNVLRSRFAMFTNVRVPLPLPLSRACSVSCNLACLKAVFHVLFCHEISFLVILGLLSSSSPVLQPHIWIAADMAGPLYPAGYILSLAAAVGVDVGVDVGVGSVVGVLGAHWILVEGILNVTLAVFSQCFLGMVIVSRLQPLQSVVIVMVQPRS